MTDKYEKEIEVTSNSIQLKTATRSDRKGLSYLRDFSVFARIVWSEAFSYLSPLQTILIFTALITPAIGTINSGIYEFQSWMGVSQPWQFPLTLSALFSVIALIFIFIFGLLSVRHAGTYKSNNEISAKMNPGFRLLWEKDEEILNRLEELEKKLGGDKE